MKIGIYSRVSTDRQTSENQRIQLLAFASSQRWTVAREFTDKATGSKATATTEMTNLSYDEMDKLTPCRV